MAQNTDVAAAIESLTARQADYKKYRDYYDGDHPLAFATDKFTSAFGHLFSAFADNMCATVVDALADRVRLEGFSIDQEGEFPEWQASLDALVKRNRLLLRSNEVHLDAFKGGDCFVIVLPDALGEATFYVNRGDTMAASYDEESEPRWAAKWWREPDRRIRLNLYYPDRIEKYRTGAGSYVSGLEEARGFRLFETIFHGYGRVPVFHFANNAGIGEYGRSELRDVTPLQDALNKSIMDMMVAMEFVALPQRWIAGIDLERDPVTGRFKWPFEAGVDRVWAVDDPNTKFGEFPSTNLEQFLKTQEQFRLEVARVSGTPLHYLMMTAGNFPSGESMKTAEARAIAKTEDRTASFGETWQDAVSFGLWLDTLQDVPVKAEWRDTAPRSEKEFADTLLVHQQLEPVFLRKTGMYSGSDLEEIQASKDQAAADQALLMGQEMSANPGDQPGAGQQLEVQNEG